MATPAVTSQQSSSEDILGRKTDLCLANALVKTGLGFGTGVVLSAIIFKRRSFPVWLFTGAGMGSAYTECQTTFNPAAVPGYRVADQTSAVLPHASAYSAPKPTAGPVPVAASKAV